MVYSPAEDSFLLENEVKKYLQGLNPKERNNLKVLDMGSGSGIQAKACIQEGIKNSQVLAVDIDKEAVKFLNKQNLKTIQSNLFLKIDKSRKFDLIIFNAPYLPEDKYDNQADTTAGKKGYEIIFRFLKQAKPYLSEKGEILLLFSSFSKPKIILNEAKALGYKFRKLNEKNIFFETLFVYELKL